MENLDQIRAKSALLAAKTIGLGAEGGENVAKKVPTMIRENGILGAAAFAKETGKGYEDVFDAIIKHLRKVKRIPDAPMKIEAFIEHLTTMPAEKLRAVTAETMAYLNYLRRFAGKKGGRE